MGTLTSCKNMVRHTNLKNETVIFLNLFYDITVAIISRNLTDKVHCQQLGLKFDWDFGAQNFLLSASSVLYLH